jgi:hypothetical protein
VGEWLVARTLARMSPTTFWPFPGAP